MKPTLFASLLLVPLLSPLQAQTPDNTPSSTNPAPTMAAPPAPTMAAPAPTMATPATMSPHRDRFAEMLNLTPDQEVKFQQLRQEQHTQIGAIMADTSLTAGARREKFKMLHEDFITKRNAILTPAQLAKLPPHKEIATPAAPATPAT